MNRFVRSKFLFILYAFVTLFIKTASLDGFVEKTDKITAADELLDQNSRIANKYFFEFRNKTFIGYPNVYSPVIFPGAQKQADIPLKKGDYFLEIGCGTRIFSVLAALEGADFVCATDINPDAIANTLENAQLHHVSNKMKVLQGDMFSPLKKDDLFDIIFFNIPFCHRNKKTEDLTMLARSLYDPEHDLLYRFLKEGKEYLKPSGKMLLGYSTTHGDVDLMYQWAKEYGWNVTLISKVGDENKDFITVEMYEFKPIQRSGQDSN